MTFFDLKNLVWFIGAWVGLKFALNYRRREMKIDADYKQAMLALVGNALSFSFAIFFAAWLTGQI